MAKKGQMELIVAVGLLVVVAVVIVLVYQTNIISPPELSPDLRLVKDSVENFIRAAAYDTMKTVGLHGGYITPTISTVIFLGDEVPYWQQNGQITIPDLAANLAAGIKAYISDNKAAIESSMSDKSVVLGDPQVSVNLLPNEINVVVYMATSAADKPLQQPYTISIPSKLGDIYDFSKKFVAANNQQRYMEKFTISSMMLSPLDNGVQSVPILPIFLTQCGQQVFRTWWDIQPAIQDTIETTLAHTYMPGKAPINVMTTTNYPKYSLTALDGKNYADIAVSFFLPDGFGLTRQDFSFTPEPINALAQSVGFGICMSDPIQVQFFVRYPTVVRIEDPLTQNVFQFAVDVAIKENQPAAWADISGYNATEQELICQNPVCTMKLDVKDSSGKPVPYADVSFMGCPAGTTDADGIIDAGVPCGIGPLNIYKNKFDAYDEMHSSDRLANLSVTLTKSVTFTAHFYEVVIDKDSSTQKYLIRKGSIRPTVNEIRENTVQLTVYNQATRRPDMLLFKDSAGRLANVAAGSRRFVAVLVGNMDTAAPSVNGIMATDFAVREDMDGKDIYLYIPYYPDVNGVSGADQAVAVAATTNVLSKCGMGPIAESEVDAESVTPCEVSFVEAGA